MPRRKHDWRPNMFYHVVMRGNNRHYIFKTDGDLYRLISVISQVLQDFRFSLMAFCIMSNHYHLLIRSEDDLAKCIVWGPGTHFEAVFASLRTGCNKEYEIWKFSRYFDNPEYWSDPGVSDTTLVKEDGCLVEIVKTEPVCDQFEMYNLAEDPLETNNLDDSANATDETEVIRCKLEKLLADQRCKKRLSPGN